MELKSILTAALLAAAPAAFAQNWVNDSVALGANYANDAYYELQQGTTKYQSATDWHLGFQMMTFGAPHFNAAIRANHAKAGVEVYAINKNPSGTFATLSAADTVGKMGAMQQLYNNDSSWGTGAFFQNRSSNDLFDFGWGQYQSSPTHSLLGTTLYVLKAGGNAYKFWMKEYISTPADSIRYTFRIAKLDGSKDTTVSIYRKRTPLFTDRLMAYYNIDSSRVMDREPSRVCWDLLFTNYKDQAAGIPGYVPAVTGVLTNEGTSVADVRGVEPDASKYASYNYTSRADEIGWDWKKGGAGGYVVPDTFNYFVKTGVYKEYYQIRFTRFESSSTGKIVFQKRLLGKESVGVKNLVSSLNTFMVVPNPAPANANLVIDARKAAPGAQLLVTDMAGRVVANGTLDIRAGMNAFALASGNWAAGTYIVTVAGTDWKMSSQMVVVR